MLHRPNDPVASAGVADEQVAFGSSRRETDRVLLLVAAGVRGLVLVQLLVALPGSVGKATDVGLFSALTVALFVESAVWVVLYHRDPLRPYAATWFDVSVMALLVATAPLFSSIDDRVGTWVAWGFAAGTSSAFNAGLTLPRLWQPSLACSVIAVAYLTASLPGSATTGTTSAVLANTVSFFGFAAVARLASQFLRRTADVADAARREAAESARKAELDRHRLLLHDQATVLRLLAEPTVDPDLADHLRRQAGDAANRIRHFLDRDHRDLSIGGAVGAAPTVLSVAVAAAAHDFTDLPLQLNLDRATTVEVDPQRGHAVAAAIHTLLHNVRAHASATAVTVHAAGVDDHSWELSVSDNGSGFDIATTPLGFGLATQAGSILDQLGIERAVDSRPGEGTIVTLRGPSKAAS